MTSPPALRPGRDLAAQGGSSRTRLDWALVEHDFVALGHAGSDAYAGLESFPNPGIARVELVSDELTAMCPITNQPDFYTATIRYEPRGLCLESKSLKIYLSRFRDQGAFCEALAVQIRDEVAAALELEQEFVHVTLEQKARGGITITASV
jgi:7-cyano-7-deazaguanine reductase